MPSRANYVFAQLDFPAAPLLSHLLEHRILIRDCTGAPGVQGAAVRIAVRPHARTTPDRGLEGVLVRALIVLLRRCALSAQPQRIVSTSPSITETLFALGLGDRVVAVSQHCHYPPEVNGRPRVGSYLRPNVEAIVGLRPDW